MISNDGKRVNRELNITYQPDFHTSSVVGLLDGRGVGFIVGESDGIGTGADV